MSVRSECGGGEEACKDALLAFCLSLGGGTQKHPEHFLFILTQRCAPCIVFLSFLVSSPPQ